MAYDKFANEVKEYSVNTFLSEKIGDHVQVIIFVIDNVEFAINIMDVKEIKEMERIRRLPNSQPFVQGLLNLRGDIIPVIDLKKRLELDNLKLEDIEKLTEIKRKEQKSGSIVENNDVKNGVNDNQEENNDKIEEKVEENNTKVDENNVKDILKEKGENKEDVTETLDEDSYIPSELKDKNIIICNIENTMFGILIDKILQVSYLNEEQFEPAPKLISTIGEKFLIGFAKVNKKIIPILNLYQLIFED